MTRTRLAIFITFFLFQYQASAAMLCSELFATPPQIVKIKSGALVLHEINPKLHGSAAITKAVQKHKHTTGIFLQKPTDKINQWLNSLEKISQKANSSPFTKQQIKDILHKSFIIKTDQIPEAYYNLQLRIARERGHGDIRLTQTQKNALAEEVITDQKTSLDSWIEYLVSKDTSMYPMWIKYWMFTGMTKITKYDSESGSFGNRTESTVAPFQEINHEALGLTVDYVLKYLNKESLQEITDPDLVRSLQTLNFGKIYGKILFQLKVGQDGHFATNQGTWVRYPKGSDPMPLVHSLKGRNTGWCTAGESTAQSQLAQGDFHVYYSFDKNGVANIPRVAIRMEEDEIAEIRGVAAEQNLDSQINHSNVISTKMKEFGTEADKFTKKDQDMKRLTQIEQNVKLDQRLSLSDLKFLYELESPIEGFGYESDPRINEIISKIDLKKELVNAFDKKYTADQISVTDAEFLNGKSKVHFGNLHLNNLTSVQGLVFPEMLIGSLYLGSLKSAEGLILPKSLTGFLYLGGLTSAKGLVFPETLNGGLSLGGLTSAEGLILPRFLNGSLYLDGLTSAKGLILPETLNGNLRLVQLTSAEGLILPRFLNGSLHLESLKSAKGLLLPETISRDLILIRLVSAQDLKLPKSLGGLRLDGLTSAEGLILPETLTRCLYLRSLVSAQNLKLPKGVKSYVGPKDIQKE